MRIKKIREIAVGEKVTGCIGLERITINDCLKGTTKYKIGDVVNNIQNRTHLDNKYMLTDGESYMVIELINENVLKDTN